MSFYEMALSMEFSQKTLLDIANRTLGGCKPEAPRYVDCKFSNREVNLSYFPNEKLVYIYFSFISEPEDMVQKPMGGEDDTYPTAQSLQKGTKEGVYKFIAFAKELKSYGVGIKYTTKGRGRENIYSLALKKAGMSPVTTGDQGWIWR